MIPLFFNEPGNNQLLTYDSAYMWGDAFLVSPVKSPGISQQRIYLPAGSSWTDFYSGEVHQGGKYIYAALNPENIPVYVKGGSFIPMMPEAKSTADYSLNRFELHYFADTTLKTSRYSLYNDDGKTPYAYEKGSYEIAEFTAAESDLSLKISYSKTRAGGTFEKSSHDIMLIVHNIKEKPAGIRINDSYLSPSKWDWDGNTGKLSIETGNQGKTMLIEIIRRLY